MGMGGHVSSRTGSGDSNASGATGQSRSCSPYPSLVLFLLVLLLVIVRIRPFFLGDEAVQGVKGVGDHAAELSACEKN